MGKVAFLDPPRGHTVHSMIGDAASALSCKVTSLVRELWFVIGDVVGLGSNICSLAKVDAGVMTPAFNALNGVCCFFAGLFILAVGLSGIAEGIKNKDPETGVEGGLHTWIGGAMGAAGPLKVVVGSMQVMQMMAVLPDVVVPFITTLTYTFALLFGLMFAGFTVRSIFYGIELHRFQMKFKAILESELDEEKLSHHWTLKGLWNEALSKVSDKEALATNVVIAIREKIEYEPSFKRLVGRSTREDVVQEFLDSAHKGNPTPEMIIDHMCEKWSHRAIWNAILGVLATVCIPALILTVTFATGPVGIAVTVAWIVIFAAMLIGFDGWSYIEAFKSDKPGKWDGLFLLTTTLLLVGVSIAVVVLTSISGGIAPLIVCGVVGGVLLLLHLAALIKVAHRKYIEVNRDQLA